MNVCLVMSSISCVSYVSCICAYDDAILFLDSEIEKACIEDSDKIKFEPSLRSIDCTSHFDGKDMERVKGRKGMNGWPRLSVLVVADVVWKRKRGKERVECPSVARVEGRWQPKKNENCPCVCVGRGTFL